MEKQDFFFSSSALWLFDFVPEFPHDIRPFCSAQRVNSAFYAKLLRSDSTSSINLSLGHPLFYLPPGVSSSNHFAALSLSTLTCQSHSHLHTSITVKKVTDLNLLHVVTSKRPRNYFISVKFKTIQSFMLYIHQNNPLVQIDTSASDWRGVENIPGSHFVKAFAAPPSHS
jgi:hypothetical protein